MKSVYVYTVFLDHLEKSGKWTVTMGRFSEDRNIGTLVHHSEMARPLGIKVRTLNALMRKHGATITKHVLAWHRPDEPFYYRYMFDTPEQATPAVLAVEALLTAAKLMGKIS